MERLTEDAARKAAASLGFPYFIGLSDGISLAAVVRHPQNPLKSLCGVYLQIRKSGGFYIGQTRNLLQRQYDYTASGIEIDWLAFQPVPLKRLTQPNMKKFSVPFMPGFRSSIVSMRHGAFRVIPTKLLIIFSRRKIRMLLLLKVSTTARLARNGFKPWNLLRPRLIVTVGNGSAV